MSLLNNTSQLDEMVLIGMEIDSIQIARVDYPKVYIQPSFTPITLTQKAIDFFKDQGIKEIYTHGYIKLTGKLDGGGMALYCDNLYVMPSRNFQLSGLSIFAKHSRIGAAITDIESSIHSNYAIFFNNRPYLKNIYSNCMAFGCSVYDKTGGETAQDALCWLNKKDYLEKLDGTIYNGPFIFWGKRQDILTRDKDDLLMCDEYSSYRGWYLGKLNNIEFAKKFG